MTASDFIRELYAKNGKINTIANLFGIEPFKEDGSPNMTSDDNTDYIFANEFNWCHSCGMYRIILPISVCEKCIRNDVEAAKQIHEQASEEFKKQTSIRRICVPTSVFENIRRWEHGKIKFPDPNAIVKIRRIIKDLSHLDVVNPNSFSDTLQEEFKNYDPPCEID